MHRMSSDAKEVIILLALYNGAKNIDEQLHSFLNQTHDYWSLIVSDDGSTDVGLSLVRKFQKENPDRKISIIPGPKKGFVCNFLSLLGAVDPNVDYVALSDQDDVWLEDKLERALSQLQNIPQNTLAIYGNRTLICDEDLTAISLSHLHKKQPSFQNALVQNILPGNTMVINNAALNVLKETSPLATETSCHDWWIYQMITGAGGIAIYDKKSSLKYRQHANNQIGANISMRASLARLRLVVKGRFKIWNIQNIATLEACADWLTDDNRVILADFKKTRDGGIIASINGLYKSGAYRQSLKGNIALFIAALFGKI